MATFTGADKAIKHLFDIVANIADDYSASSTYNVGDYAIYSGVLYKCSTAITTAENFTPAHWLAVLVMAEVAAGGGGGGTTVIANPAGAATATLNKLQVGATIYDVPSGGGSSGHTYSYTEQIVGVWIDGKTIYETTYRVDVSVGTSGSVQMPNNIDTIIRIEGFVIQNNTNNEVAVNFCNDSTDKANVYYRKSDNTIQIRTGTTYGSGIFYITAQYTKSV